MHPVYDLLWHAVLPWLPLRLWWRGRKEPGYRVRVGERFGRYATGVQGPVLWVHAVSLGETNAARPLIERLLAAHPQATLLLTHMTATGRAAGAKLAGPRVLQSWLPYDLPWAVDAFLDHFRPAAGILLETELWPNLVTHAARRGIPMFLVNARLSERSAARYRRVPRVTREVLQALAGVAAQTAADAARLAALGAPEPAVTGSLKFDVRIPADVESAGVALRARLGRGRPVVLAASTREGEEALLLDALAGAPLPERTLLVIVPRHPQRFDAVAKLLADRGVPCVRRSADVPVGPDALVFLGDSMGEMAAYCAAADVVLMGGSLLPLGGQNLIEPLSLGKPTIVGAHMFNFAEATAGAVAAGAALQVSDAAQALGTAGALLADNDRRQRMSAAALAFHAAHRGAEDRLWRWLAPRIAAALANRQLPAAAVSDT